MWDLKGVWQRTRESEDDARKKCCRWRGEGWGAGRKAGAVIKMNSFMTLGFSILMTFVTMPAYLYSNFQLFFYLLLFDQIIPKLSDLKSQFIIFHTSGFKIGTGLSRVVLLLHVTLAGVSHSAAFLDTWPGIKSLRSFLQVSGASVLLHMASFFSVDIWLFSSLAQVSLYHGGCF